jgi:predicted PurR-regulated permease PerM
MLKLAFDGITSFSTLPLYFAAGFSCLLFAGAVLYALYVLFVRFVAGNVVSGWASVLFILLIIGGFLSLFLAVIGMYLAAIYDEVKQRPTYIVEHNHETHT